MTTIIDHIRRPLGDTPDSPVLLLSRPERIAQGRLTLEVFRLAVVSAKSLGETWLAIGEVHMRPSWKLPEVASLSEVPSNAKTAIHLAAARAVDAWREQLASEAKTRDYVENRAQNLRAAVSRLADLEKEIAGYRAQIASGLAQLPENDPIYSRGFMLK